MILKGQNFYKISIIILLFLQSFGVHGDAEADLRSPDDIYTTADMLLDVARGNRKYSLEEYAQVILTKLDLIEALDIALWSYSCDALKNFLQALSCQKNLATDEIKNNFEAAVNSPDFFDLKPCLEPFKDECKDLIANLEDEVKNLQITNAADVDKAVDTIVTAMKFGDSDAVEDLIINVAKEDQGIEKTSKVIKGIVSTANLEPEQLLKTLDGVLNKDIFDASDGIRSGIATAIEEGTYSDTFIQALALEIKQQVSSDRRRSLLQQGTSESCRQLLMNEVRRAIRENIKKGQQCPKFNEVFGKIKEYTMQALEVPERIILEFVIFDPTLCPCLDIASLECKSKTAPLVQVYMLTDATGSMGPYIDSVKSSSEDMLKWLQSVYGNLDIALGSYRDCRDFPCPGEEYYYKLDLGFTPVDQITTITDVIQTWKALSATNPDWPETQLYALDKVGQETGWQDNAAKLLVWFGDAEGKVVEGVTLDDAKNSINSKDIVVFAIDVNRLDAKGEATEIVGNKGWLIEGTASLDVTLGQGGVGELQLTGFAAQVTQFIMKFVDCNAVPSST